MSEKEIEFLEKEHEGGQHDKKVEGCYECHRENRIMLAKKVVCACPKEYKNPYGRNYPLGYRPE